MENLTSRVLSVEKQDNQQIVNLADILRTLLRRKFTILLSVLFLLLIAFLYNFLAEPTYQASVLIKKEKSERETSVDDISKIVQIRSLDDIETEMEILKTRPILKRVIEELNLNIVVDKIFLANGNSRAYEVPLAEYQHKISEALSGNENFPLNFAQINTSQDYKKRQLLINVAKNDVIELYDYDNKVFLKAAKNTPNAHFILPDAQFKIDCTRIQPGTQVLFRILNSADVIRQLEKSISVESLRKTNLFRVTYKSSSPYMTQLIANTIVDKFRGLRLELKQQTIRYSYNFVDQQLEEISQKLKDAEANLSNFKKERQIIKIDEISTEIAEFLSNLEAERIKTGLELSDYQSRYKALKEELESKGYFDQTYLTPNGTGREDTPFGSLLRQLSDAELERLTLLEKRTENHPDVQAVNRRILEIKRNLSNYNQNTIASYEIIIKTLKDKEIELQKSIAEYTRKIKNLPQYETTLTELIRQKKVYEKMFVMLLDKREEMRISELSKLQDIVVVEPASRPLEPIHPRKRLNLAVSVFLGLMAGVTIVFVQELFTKKIRTLEEIEDEFMMPILAILPKFPASIRKKIRERFNIDSHINILMDNQFGFKESYHILRTKLSYLMPNQNIIIFTSCEENSGKTTVLTNFAVSLALNGKKIFIVDCDLRKPKIGEFFNLPYGGPGIISFLKDKQMSSPPIYNPLNEYGISKIKLDVVPSGGYADNAVELLESNKFRNFLEAIATQYDYVFIDTPPLTRTADVFVLGSFLKDVILIVNPELTIKQSLQWGIRSLKQFEMNILGSVINGCDVKDLTDRYRYGYGYTYGYDYVDDRIKGLPPPSR